MFISSQFERSVHHGGKAQRQEPEIVGHVAFTVRKKTGTKAGSSHAQCFIWSWPPVQVYGGASHYC